MRERFVGENQRVNLTFLLSGDAHVGVTLARLYLVSSFRSCQITALQRCDRFAAKSAIAAAIAGLCERCVFASLRAPCALRNIRGLPVSSAKCDKLWYFSSRRVFSSLLWQFPLSDLNLGHLHLDRSLIDIIRDHINKNLSRSLYVEASLDR